MNTHFCTFAHGSGGGCKGVKVNLSTSSPGCNRGAKVKGHQTMPNVTLIFLHLDVKICTTLYLVDVCVVDVGSAQFNCVSFYLSVILLRVEHCSHQRS